MTNFSKKECIRVLESFGWKYLGFNDIGWGEKFYTFKIKGETGYRTMKLGEMRSKAYNLDMNRWFKQQQQDEHELV